MRPRHRPIRPRAAPERAVRRNRRRRATRTSSTTCRPTRACRSRTARLAHERGGSGVRVARREARRHVPHLHQGFPLTLRLYGPDSNSDDFVQFKRAGLRLALLDLHPNTLNCFPSLATHWAFGADGKTVYYKLESATRAGRTARPSTADDYVFNRELQISEHIVDPYGKNYFTTIIVAHREARRPHDLRRRLPCRSRRTRCSIEYRLSPSPRHFHKLDANWVRTTTGGSSRTRAPYQISRLEKGRYIELKRIENWWGDDLKYNKNRFNVDTIRLDVIRDDNVAYEYFLRGELDRFLFVDESGRWHEKARRRDLRQGLHRPDSVLQRRAALRARHVAQSGRPAACRQERALWASRTR